MLLNRCVPGGTGRRKRAIEPNSKIDVSFEVALNDTIPLPGQSVTPTDQQLLDTAFDASTDVQAENIVVNGEQAIITDVVTPVIVTGKCLVCIVAVHLYCANNKKLKHFFPLVFSDCETVCCSILLRKKKQRLLTSKYE